MQTTCSGSSAVKQLLALASEENPSKKLQSEALSHSPEPCALQCSAHATEAYTPPSGFPDSVTQHTLGSYCVPGSDRSPGNVKANRYISKIK